MKRLMWRAALAAAMLAAAGTGLFAQGLPKPDGQGARETVTVSGALGVARGMIALTSGGKVFYLAGLGRLVGFVDGLKEGAQVTAEGYALPLPGDGGGAVLRLTKLTLGGREYDLRPLAEGRGRRGEGPEASGPGGPPLNAPPAPPPRGMGRWRR